MNPDKMNLYATAAFGLEGAVAGELKRLGMKEVQAQPGGVRYTGSVSDAFLSNLRLRFADRVMILLREEKCFSFEELFQLISTIPWEEYCSGTEAFNVSCKCARSRLMSPRDCQSITKKAILERLRRHTGQTVFSEKGAALPIRLSVHEDLVRVTLDTSGEGLSRRGYRTWNGEAPLRETLAAALVEFSPWRPGIPLYDPCCGTGTLLIEAAFRMGHRAPGMNRTFAMESFAFFSHAEAQATRLQVRSEANPEKIKAISGSDIDPIAVDLACRHLKQAGLEGKISLEIKALQQVQLSDREGVFLCNPPYGERLGDQNSCRKLYRSLCELAARHPGWTLCAISSDPGFEKAYGRKADKVRRLYNGTLECQFYIFGR